MRELFGTFAVGADQTEPGRLPFLEDDGYISIMKWAQEGMVDRHLRQRHRLADSLRRLHKVFALLLSGSVLAALPSRAQTLGGALDATNLIWTTGGDAAWFTQTTNTHDGVDAVRSGSLGSNQTSWIETTILGPATIEYWGGTAPGDRSVSATIRLNDGRTAIFKLPWYFEWYKTVWDLGAGTNVIRWTVAGFYDTTNGGFILLDEFKVLPPRPLSFTYEPQAQTVFAGAYASFSASAIGTPPLAFQWRKDDVNIPGATYSWIQYDPASTNDSGNYSVVVSNSQGFIVSSNAALTMLPPAPPSFTYQPASQTAYAGQTACLSGSVDGSPPFTFQWRKEGTNLPDGASTSSWGSAWLDLTNLTATDAGNYSLFVTNDYGSVESTNATLTVIPSVAPVMTRQPRSLEVAAGVSTWISLGVSGAPDPYVSWRKVGEPPPPPPQNPWPPFPPLPPLPLPGDWTLYPSIAFSNVSNQNAGVYWATATNLAGEVESWPALLTVLPAITNISSWWQGASDLFVTNDLVFLAQGASGVAILSVSNVAAPVLLGGYNTPGTASAVWVSDGLAYVADGSAGLQILNVANPFAPALIGSYNTTGYAYDVIVRSNLAFVADGSSGLLILDVSNPASPSALGSYSSNSLAMQKVSLAGIHALIAGSSMPSLVVVDVTNPANPLEVGRLDGYFSDLAVQEQTAFAVGGSDLKVISITNPAQPVVLGTAASFPGMFSLSAVQVANDLVYATGPVSSPGTLHVFDVRDLREPIPVGYYTNAAKAQALWVEGNRVYLSGADSTVQIVQTPFHTQPAPPAWLSLSQQAGLQLGMHGRRGAHFIVESADTLVGSPWLPLLTILQTNETCVVELPPPSGTRYFRLKQLD